MRTGAPSTRPSHQTRHGVTPFDDTTE